MNTEKFFFREYVDSDLKEVLDLWEYFSGWGRPEESEFKMWLPGPFGDAIIFLATDKSDKIVGQIFYTPTLMYLSSMEVKAVKISAPIIHEEYRSSVYAESKSLVVELFLEGNKYIKEKGYNWLYTMPAYGWVKSLKSIHKVGLFPWKIQIFPCLQILEEDVEDTKYTLHELNGFTNEFNLIWEKFKLKNSNLSFINRSKEWLNYKWRNDLIVGIFDLEKKLTGYFVIKKNSGLILDFLMIEFIDVPLLFKKLKKFHLLWIEKAIPIEKQELKIISNDFLKPFLDQLKTQYVEYKFVFGISSTVSVAEVENLDNEWFIFPND
ncbi:hypothetical protein SYJ56_23000 [Algoriphagus sp. D3-2-R+10]|uniref:hypothetical protein n=1 Tax=Algoriphagus aurantiacus TaxID=3103948 RepID=UPI002B3BB789|nr:hypothetical protein [Algoriphagus sp. D3-2-R+10]MEB2778197.1 hypothetical protein [Algoriphagus sp. D3-2-R+10]